MIEGLTITDDCKLSSPHAMRIDKLNIDLELVSYAEYRNGNNFDDDWELKIDGTLWDDLPLCQL